LTKKEKKVVVVKDDIPRDEHYYKFEESIARLTGIMYNSLNEQGAKVDVVYKCLPAKFSSITVNPFQHSLWDLNLQSLLLVLCLTFQASSLHDV